MTVAVVVDANIIIGAALGRSWTLLLEMAELGYLIIPQRAYDESLKRTATLARGRTPHDLSVLEDLATIVPSAPAFEDVARWLLGREREKDWPILATAMTFGVPIWTKDKDFSGTGVGTWNNRTIRYLIEGAIPARS